MLLIWLTCVQKDDFSSGHRFSVYILYYLHLSHVIKPLCSQRLLNIIQEMISPPIQDNKQYKQHFFLLLQQASFTESLINETLAVTAEPAFRYRAHIKKFFLTLIEGIVNPDHHSIYKKHNLEMNILETTDSLHLLHKNIKRLTYA
ncbi:unnamed protein product [Rhizopus microsporus]